MLSFFFFFFQAEDGIRDVAVTGVQTCALPISAEISTSLITDSVCAWVPSLTRTEEGDVSIGTSGQGRVYHQHLTATSHNWCRGSAASQGSRAASVVFT